MRDRGDGRLGYSNQEVALRFEQATTPYRPLPSDLYWKIAIAVPNLDLAYAQLCARGVPCSEPRQFRDVGYLAKATDPEGFTIELIDHHFRGDRPDGPDDETRLGGGPHLSLLTLRTADIASLEPQLLALGLKPLSVQPVEPFGFTLYFYAFTEDEPPNADLSSVENRAWTYRRPYSILEVQHVAGLDVQTLPTDRAAGYAGISLSNSARPGVPQLRMS
jgi:hypothetical protein